MTAEPAAAYGDSHRLRRNIASNYLTVIAQAAFLVLATPYVIDALGAEIFGGWAVILAVVGYLRLLDLGLGPATARFVAVASTPAELSTTVSTALATLTGAAVLGMLAAALAIAAVPGLLPGVEGLRTALTLAAISTALQIPLGVFSHLLFGLERIYERNLTYLARVLASAAALVIAVEAGGGLVAFVGAMAVAELVVMLAQAVWCLARLDQLELHRRHVTSAMLRVMVPFSASMFAIGVATQIAVYSSGLVVAAALGATAVAIYTVAVRAVDGASLLLAQFSDVFLPVFARLGRDSEQDRSTTLLRLGTRLGLVLGYPLIALLIGLGEPLVEVWVGDGFEDSWGPLALLGASLIFAVPLRFGLLWAIGTGRQGRIAVVALCDSLANVAAAISLVGPLGLEGVALAALGALWISNGVIMPRMIFPAAGVSLWSGYYRPTLLALGAMAPCVLVMRFALTPRLDHPAPTLLATIAWLILGTALLTTLLTDKEERAQWRGMIRR